MSCSPALSFPPDPGLKHPQSGQERKGALLVAAHESGYLCNVHLECCQFSSYCKFYYFFLNNNLGNGTVTVESHPLSLEQLLNFATFHNTRGVLLVPTQKILNAVPYWYSP